MMREYRLYSKTEIMPTPGMISCTFQPANGSGMNLIFDMPRAEADELNVADTYVLTMTKASTGQVIEGELNTSM